MSNTESKKLPYRTPQLEEYGGISQLTRGIAGNALDNKGKDKSMSEAPI
jgi:hypothetical protein